MTPDQLEALHDGDFAAMVRLMIREADAVRAASQGRR